MSLCKGKWMTRFKTAGIRERVSHECYLDDLHEGHHTCQCGDQVERLFAPGAIESLTQEDA
jgi:hypothetical protein